MPLETVETVLSPSALPTNLKNGFLIFYSSIVDDRLWCPDCTRVEDLVKKTFDVPDSPHAAIVYVGNRAEWRLPTGGANLFRTQEWNITSVPTIVKFEEGKEVRRLVDEEITPASLKAFVSSSL